MRTTETSSPTAWQSVRYCRVFAASVCLMLSSGPLCANAPTFVEGSSDTESAECDVTKLENSPLFKALDQDRRSRVITFCQNRFDAVNNGKTTVDKANRWISAFLLREYRCVGNEIAPERRQSISESDGYLPSTLIAAVGKYCSDTSNPTKYLGTNWKTLKKSNRWMQAEYFCLHTRYITEPNSKVIAFFHWTDSPAFKRLHDQSLSLCDSLREGKLDYDEADYRWKQEAELCLRQLDTEAARQFGSLTKQALGFIVGLFPK